MNYEELQEVISWDGVKSWLNHPITKAILIVAAASLVSNYAQEYVVRKGIKLLFDDSAKAASEALGG